MLMLNFGLPLEKFGIRGPEGVRVGGIIGVGYCEFGWVAPKDDRL